MKTIKPSLYVKLTRLTLVGKNGDNEYLTTWSYKNKYYNIAVTDTKTGKNVSNLRISMNETILRTLAKFMRMIETSKEEKYYSLLSKSIDFDNKDSNILLSRGKVTVGKKKIGEEFINYLAVSNEDESVKFTFPFISSKYYVFDKNGTEITKTEELSNIYLSSYIDIIESIIDELPKFTEADMFDTSENNNGDNRSYKKRPNKQFNKSKPKEDDLDTDLF